MTTPFHPGLLCWALAAAALVPLAATASPVPLTAGGTRNSFGASVSNDGQRTVFYSASNLTGGNADNNFEIFLYDRPSDTLRQITSDPGGIFFGSQTPRISGDGQHIVFQQFQSAPNGFASFQTRAYDIQGASFTTLTQPGNFQTSDISRDGTRISVNLDNLGLRLFDTAAGSFGAVLAGPGVLSHTLSGNGGRLAYATFNGGLALYDVGTGTTTTLLSGGSLQNLGPAISDDGSRVVFTSNRDLLGQNADGNAELYLYEVASASFRQLTHTTGGDARQASLSGDGRRIAFSSLADPLGLNGDSSEEIFFYDLDDGTLSQVTQSASRTFFSFEPALSADGRTLAYTSNSGGIGAGSPTQIFLQDLPPLRQTVSEPPTLLLVASLLALAGWPRRRAACTRG